MMNNRPFLSVSWFSFIILLDRITKHLALGLTKIYEINPFLELKLVFNRGIMWGVLHGDHVGIFVALNMIILSIIFSLMKYTYKRYMSGHTIYAELAVLAGAWSNIIDRFVYDGVIDFVHMHIENWSWPVFNIADVAIVTGISYMIWEHYQES